MSSKRLMRGVVARGMLLATLLICFVEAGPARSALPVATVIPPTGAVLAGTITWTLHGQISQTTSGGGETHTYTYRVDATTTYIYVAGASIAMRARITLLNDDRWVCSSPCSDNREIRETLTGSYSGPARDASGNTTVNDSTGEEYPDGTLQIRPTFGGGSYPATGTYMDTGRPSDNGTFQLRAEYPDRDSWYPGGFPTYQALTTKTGNPTLSGNATDKLADTIVVGVAVPLEGQETVTWHLVVVYWNGVRLKAARIPPTPTSIPLAAPTRTPLRGGIVNDTPTPTLVRGRIANDTPTPTLVQGRIANGTATPTPLRGRTANATQTPRPVARSTPTATRVASPQTCRTRPAQRAAPHTRPAAPAAGHVGHTALLSATLGQGASGYGLDWEMPRRVAATMLLTSDHPPAGVAINPSRWRVILFATLDGRRSCNKALHYSWEVAGQSRQGCVVTIVVPHLGPYAATLTIRRATSPGAAIVALVCQPIDPQDRLVVGLGDSVASGEGNPDRESPVSTLAGWQSRACHRSAHSFEALTAQAMERADPHTSITFLYLACSGASIEQGLIGPEIRHPLLPGLGKPSPIPPQLAEMKRLAAGRPIDQVLLSIGANDVGFDEVAAFCSANVTRGTFRIPCPGLIDRGFQAPGFRAGGKLQTVGEVVDSNLERLPAHLARLEQALRAAGVQKQQVVLTEYFDPTADAAGTFCTWFQPLGLRDGDIPWAYGELVAGTNEQLLQAARRYGWRYVGGIATRFRTHGYCAILKASWIVNLQDSLRRQGDVYGTLHPTLAGQRVIAQQVVQRLQNNPSPVVDTCGARYVVCFSRRTFPTIAPNIRRGQQRGLPMVLTYLGAGNPQKQRNRQAACNPAREKRLLGYVIKAPLSCDEYPFASTVEGGANTIIAAVPTTENNAQGTKLSDFYRQAFGFKGGSDAQFLVRAVP